METRLSDSQSVCNNSDKKLKFCTGCFSGKVSLADYHASVDFQQKPFAYQNNSVCTCNPGTSLCTDPPPLRKNRGMRRGEGGSVHMLPWDEDPNSGSCRILSRIPN